MPRKPELTDELFSGVTRASVKRTSRNLWRVQVRRGGLVMRTSWHEDWQVALDDAIRATRKREPVVPAPQIASDALVVGIW